MRTIIINLFFALSLLWFVGQVISQKKPIPDFAERKNVVTNTVQGNLNEKVSELPDPCTLKVVSCTGNPSKRTTIKLEKSFRVDSTKMSLFKKVCLKRNIKLDSCPKTLYAIMWIESRGNEKEIGDGGRARGAFQIWYKLHGLTIAQAEDLKTSSLWTLDHLLANGYPTYRSWAIGSHNSKTPVHNKLYSHAVLAFRSKL